MMTMQLAVDIVSDVLLTSLIILAPLVGVGILVGLIVSLIQSVTSIQEQTLTFIPKLVAVSLTMIVLAHWIIRTLTEFTIENFEMITRMAP